MKKCKICNEDLYRTISFNNLFRIDYVVHEECINNLVINNDRAAFPILNNIVYYDYLFYDRDNKLNIEYLENEYFIKLFNRNLVENDWSIIIVYSEGLFNDFSQDDMRILFSLANTPILIVSVIYYDFSTLFTSNIWNVFISIFD